MNALGDGKSINTIKMRHQGTDVEFNKMESPWHSGSTGVPVERGGNLTLEFQDLYEVDNLIYALQKFKEACELHMGSWERV